MTAAHSTWNVLAAAYAGKSPKLASTLTHAAQVDADGYPVSVLCGRVKLDSLCEYVGGEPSCARCAVMLAKVAHGLR